MKSITNAKQLRLYTFVNFYLSSIQQGIQSAHVAVELFNDYRGGRSKATELLYNWGWHGKTMIVLNGGMASDVDTGFNAVASFNNNRYPYVAFYEEPGAIHEARSAITAWGIVLPPEVYDAKPVEVFPSRAGFSILKSEHITPETPIWEPGSFEHFICSYLQGKSLAR